jgi:two-component system chemotaxis response regulator CheY
MSRILVADDDATIRRLMSVFLKTLGHTADLAEDGSAALEACLMSQPDLLISDIHMPLIGGIELTHRLRADPRFDAMPILLFSASITQGDEANWRGAGANGFISKPPTLSGLKTTLENLLAG